MNDTHKLAEEFMALFEGYRNAYGTYIIHDKYAVKKKGKGTTIKAPVTLDIWQKHLDGSINSGIGIVPINEEAECKWGCLDIDSYEDFDVVAFAREVKDTPLVICRSKSGGAHCFLFVKEAIPAGLMQMKLRELSAALGYAGCEIFPKQKQRTSSGDIGNWLNMPYFDYTNTVRYGIDGFGNKLSAEEFLAYARTKQIKNEQEANEVSAVKVVDEDFDALFAEGPPCHEALYKRGIRATEDGRNNSLWSIAQQFRRQAADNWESLLLKFNTNHCSPPLSTAEVQSIINSVKKGDGFYKCNDACCSQNCDKEICYSRKFGVGDKSSLMPKFTGIQKAGGARDCLWYLTLDTSETVELTTEELVSPAKVRMRLAEALATPLLLPEIKAEQWRKILSKLFDNACEIIEETSTVDDVFYELVEDFCLGQRTSTVLADVLAGRAVKQPEGVYFRLKDLMKFLDDKRTVRLTSQQISAKLRSVPTMDTDEQGRKVTIQKDFCHYVKDKRIKVNGQWKTLRLWLAPYKEGDVEVRNDLPEALMEDSPFEYNEYDDYDFEE